MTQIENSMNPGVVHSAHKDHVGDVIQGWKQREEEASRNGCQRRKTKTNNVLPSEVDPNFRYGMSTREIDMKNDPFMRSNHVIEQRMKRQDRELNKPGKVEEKKKIDPRKPTAASIGHTKKKEQEPQLKDTFKMKRFTNFEHGKVDTNLRKGTKV